jgi:hypothetical protein
MVLLLAEILAMQGAFNPEGISVNGPDASKSSPSGRTSEDIRSRMLGPIEPTTTGVQIFNAIKASHEKIIADDMPSTAKGHKEHNSSHRLPLLDYTLNCLRDFYLPGLALLKHDIYSIYSELSSGDSSSILSRFLYTSSLFDDIKRVNVLRRGLNDVQQTIQGFQLLKIRINEADYSTPLAYTVKLMGEWVGEEYASTCILKYIFDKCVPRFRFHHRFLVKLERPLFRSGYPKYFDFRRTPPKISCTLPFFTHKKAPTHDQLFNTTWVRVLPYLDYPCRRLLDHHVRELPCANYPPATFSKS